MLNRFLIKISLDFNTHPLPGSKCANCIFRKSGRNDVYIKCNAVEPLRVLSALMRRGIPIPADLGDYSVYERILKMDIPRHILGDKMFRYHVTPNNVYGAIEDLINRRPLDLGSMDMDENYYNELDKIYRIKDEQCLNCVYVKQVLEVDCDILNAGELLFNSPNYDMYIPVSIRTSLEPRASSFKENAEEDEHYFS